MYDIRKIASKHRNCHLKELHIISMVDATAACAIYYPDPLQNFCADDVVMSGDLDSAKDEFYE